MGFPKIGVPFLGHPFKEILFYLGFRRGTLFLGGGICPYVGVPDRTCALLRLMADLSESRDWDGFRV